MSASLYTVVIPARANQPSTLYLGWYAKNPSDTVTYSIDATGYLFALGLSILSATITVNDDSLTISNVGSSGGVTQFQASGGTDVTSYGITWTATLSDGTTISRVIWLPVLSLYPESNTPTIIAKGDKGDPGLDGTITLAALTTIVAELPTSQTEGTLTLWLNDGVLTYT